MTPDEPFRPTIRSQADLERAWRHLMEPLGFSDRSMWFMLIGDDDRPVAHLTEIAELPERLDEGALGGLPDFLEHLRVQSGAQRVAVLLTRPGAGGLTDTDRTAARHVYDACRRTAMAVEVVHVATDTELVPVPLDDLPLPRSA